MAGTSVQVVGLPGTGRSTFLDAVADTLDDAGWTVVRIHGVRALRDRPLEALAIAELVPRSDARTSSAVSVATAQVRAALTGRRAVLVIDDVDALDATSSGAVAAAHALGPFPVLTSSRPRRRAHVVPGADLQPAIQVTVDAVGFDVFQDLLADVLPGSAAAGLSARLFTLSGGIPGLAVAILDVARRSGTVLRRNGTWELTHELFSPTLAPAVEPFLDDLTDDARSAIEDLALVGTVPVTTARAIAGSETLAAIETAGLLRFASRGQDLVVGVYPHALAEYLRETVPRVRRLELADLHPDDVDREPAPAGPPLPVWLPAPSNLRDRGRRDDQPETSGTVLNRLFLEDWYRSTLARRAAWERDPSVYTALPYLRTLVVGDAEPRTMHDLLDRIPPTDDPLWRTRAELWRAVVLAAVENDVPAATRGLQDARRSAGDLGIWIDGVERWMQTVHGTVPPRAAAVVDPAAPVAARQSIEVTEAQRRVALGDARGALTFDVPASYDDDAPLDVSAWSRAVRGVALVADGRYEEALASSRAELERGRAELDPDVIHGHGYVVSLALLQLLRLNELRAHLGVTLSIGLRSTLHRQFEAGNRSISAAVAALEGRTDTARALAQQAAALPHALGPFPLTTPTWALGLLDVRAHGEDAESRQRAADALWAESRTLVARGDVLAGGLAGVVAVDFAPDADRLTELEAACAGADSALLRAALRLARLSGAGPDETVAVGRELLADGHLLLGARAFAHAAGALQQSGDADRSRQVLGEARELVRRRGGEPETILRPASRGGGLTDREREIANLAVAGLSNGEIAQRLQLSLRTVQNTLGRVVAKVGVAGRADLTREVLDL